MPASGRPALRHDDHPVEPLSQEVHPPIDLAQPALAIDVLGVLGAITLGRGLGNSERHRRALDAPQVIEFGT